MSQKLTVTLHIDICKLSLEKHCVGLDGNGNLLVDIGLKELVRKMVVCTELTWVVFGCCFVVF